ncbi:glycosyltransferase [Aequorivita sp. SDUM287046]|uniref:Glycosyltransferase n=1 Tax=Aequorivita aurantiaca TaxID=3053356 RepID=A0ABT8DGU2_9FLAO|nr:glycosyltransferase [Aequorivita aurantiaca]MDN3724138.1 glycosyltransferase [Aequorivita aurantiaca]
MTKIKTKKTGSLHNDVLAKNKTQRRQDNTNYDMVVFCHLRWKFVYQRPQHIISRLSATQKILFIEEPIPFSSSEEFEYNLETVTANLTVMQPKVSTLADIGKILKKLNLQTFEYAWFYSPAFAELLPDLKVNTIIYDCMDELSLFKGASESLQKKEQYLIKEADIIFTGGKSLYESKSKLSQNVHCFPSSVDLPHFKKVERQLPCPEDLVNIQHPVVGYIGVIDERIDLPLVAATAEKLPHFQFVMIGPLAKIDENDLPRRENIHYLGMKEYKELPNYLKAIDIAMMPFALNDATKYISPTKTLEYMAAGKPIISTPVKDVVRDYQEHVHIVETESEFCTALESIVKLDKVDYSARYCEILHKTSWDNTVSQMFTLIKKVAQ